jgi:hypothetical protein
MHTLIGFIQLLLMLTQNRLMPDLAFVWREDKVAAVTAAPKPGASAWQLPEESLHSFRAEGLRNDDKDKWLPPVYTKAPSFRPDTVQNLVWPKKDAGSDKLYLVFCQLKADG